MKLPKKFGDVFSLWVDAHKPAENATQRQEEEMSPAYLLYTHKNDIIRACEDDRLRYILQESDFNLTEKNTLTIKTKDAQKSFLVEMSHDKIVSYVNKMFLKYHPKKTFNIKRVKSVHS